MYFPQTWLTGKAGFREGRPSELGPDTRTPIVSDDESSFLNARPVLTSPPRVYHYFLLGIVVLVLGFNWPILHRGVELIPPLWLITLRLWGGALIGFGINAAARKPAALPRQDWKIIAVLGIFRLLTIFVLIFFALQILPPGRSGILVWTGTLWTVPLAVAFLGERLSRMQIWGLAIGMFGLGVVVEPWELSLSEPRVLWGYLMLLGAAFSVAWTSVYIRSHSWGATSLVSAPWQMLAGAAPALAAALAFSGPLDIEWTWETALIVVYQITLAGPLAVWCQLEAFRHIPAVSVNLTLMATPVVGLLSSWWLADEAFTLPLWSGLFLITAGVTANVLGDENMRPVREKVT